MADVAAFDIKDLHELMGDLSALTGFYLSLYGDKGELLIPLLDSRKLLSRTTSSPGTAAEYQDFVRKTLQKTQYRHSISILKGPEGRYHFFIPLRVNGSFLTMVGGGVSLADADPEKFSGETVRMYDSAPGRTNMVRDEVCVRSSPDVLAAARSLRTILNLFLQRSHSGNFHEKRYRLVKTVLNLLSDVTLDKQPGDLYSIMVDMILFLFNADSIAIMKKEGNIVRTIESSGRLTDHLRSLELKVTGILSEVMEQRKPAHSESVLDILRLGFGEKVTSFYAFPIISHRSIAGILTVINSRIQKDDVEILSTICRIMGCFFHLIELQDVYQRCMKEINLLNVATSNLIPVRDPEILYETILDTSVHLAGAEKGSLMLADEETSFLTVKAARGINKRFFSEIQVRSGEGIAGRVFCEGAPLIVSDIEKHEWGLSKRPKYRTGSFMSIPLKIGEKTIGLLNMADKLRGSVFSEEDMTLLVSFASYASIALERSTYYSLAGHLRELSVTDPLTGLFNRRYFEERFFEELHRSHRHTLSFSLAMMDIDDFKLFNDSEGHLAGDEVLRSIANIAKDSLRVIDVIARFGGEEFAVIMPQTEKEEAFLVAERIRNSIKTSLPCTWTDFPRKNVTVSIGIATFPSDGRERKELIRNADKALYTAKLGGKDRTVSWRV